MMWIQNWFDSRPFDSEETAGSETRVIGARSVVVELAEVVWSARVVATAAAVASGKTLSDDF